MKKHLTTCLMLCMGIATAFGQTAPAATQATQGQAAQVNPNAPEITFEKDKHDYGTIKQGSDGTYEFRFKNTGKEPLVITNATGSCGCTVPEWPKTPIKPGETGVIKVSYDTKRAGNFTKTVTVTSNAKTSSKVLVITGNVVEEQQTEGIPFRKTEQGASPFEQKIKNF